MYIYRGRIRIQGKDPGGQKELGTQQENGEGGRGETAKGRKRPGAGPELEGGESSSTGRRTKAGVGEREQTSHQNETEQR